jgi:hypothetical protein
MATMKKIILSLLFMLLVSGSVFTQVKVRIYLDTARISNPGGYWKINVMAQVLTGQTWRVGSSNIRVDKICLPSDTAATVKPDNPAVGANTNLSNPSNPNYSAMTTTSISGGTAISLNISRLGNCYLLTPGTYKLGEIRFNRLNPAGCIKLTIRTTSVMQDSITAMAYPTAWTITQDTTCIRLDSLVGVPGNNELPTVFKLYNNYPNPFNPATTIKYDVPRGSNISITIYDVLGKEVDKLVNGFIQPGRYEVLWDARNYASGTYFYRFESESYVNVKKMVLVK